MAEHRKIRVGEEIRRELYEIVRDEIKDPRVKESLVSITHVDVAKDMRYATVYLSCLAAGSDETQIVSVFKQAAGFIRVELAKRLNLRFTPELTFKFDSSIKTGARINQLLREGAGPAAGEGESHASKESEQ